MKNHCWHSVEQQADKPLEHCCNCGSSKGWMKDVIVDPNHGPWGPPIYTWRKLDAPVDECFGN